MSSEAQKKAVAISVNDKLKVAAKRMGGDTNAATQFVHARYAYERLMARLQRSSAADRWVIKGGVLMLALDSDTQRMTMDMDFSVTKGRSPRVTEILAEVCAMSSEPEDGMSYELIVSGKDAPRLIREESEQPTARLKLVATIHCARPAERKFILDVTGTELDFVPARRAWKATVPGFDALEVPAYPWNLVIAEKLHSILTGTLKNPRLRDYIDVISLGRSDVIKHEEAAAWIDQVFDIRGDAGKQLNDDCDGLSTEFANLRQADWEGTLTRTGNTGGMPALLQDAISEVAGVLSAIRGASPPRPPSLP